MYQPTTFLPHLATISLVCVGTSSFVFAAWWLCPVAAQVLWQVQVMIEQQLVRGRAPMRHPNLEFMAVPEDVAQPESNELPAYDSRNPRKTIRELVKYQMASQRQFEDSPPACATTDSSCAFMCFTGAWGA